MCSRRKETRKIFSMCNIYEFYYSRLERAESFFGKISYKLTCGLSLLSWKVELVKVCYILRDSDRKALRIIWRLRHKEVVMKIDEWARTTGGNESRDIDEMIAKAQWILAVVMEFSLAWSITIKALPDWKLKSFSQILITSRTLNHLRFYHLKPNKIPSTQQQNAIVKQNVTNLKDSRAWEKQKPVNENENLWE